MQRLMINNVTHKDKGNPARLDQSTMLANLRSFRWRKVLPSLVATLGRDGTFWHPLFVSFAVVFSCWLTCNMLVPNISKISWNKSKLEVRRLQDAYHFRYFWPSHIQRMYSRTFRIWYIGIVIFTVQLLETAVSMCRPRCDVWIIFVLLSRAQQIQCCSTWPVGKHKHSTKLHIETYEDIQKTSKNNLAKVEEKGIDAAVSL